MNLLRKSKARFARRATLQQAARRAQAARDAAQYRLGEAHREAQYTRRVGPEREDGVVSIGERPQYDTIRVLPPARMRVRPADYSDIRDYRVLPVQFVAEEHHYQVGDGAIRWWTWRPA